MKYNITINQLKSVEWGLSSSEAIVFSWIYSLPSWATKIEFGNKTYFFGSKNEACKELPIVTDKEDTMYRIYKSLEKKGLLELINVSKCDYICITDKGKKWYDKVELPKLGNKSEDVRNEIRENSEINPTYNNTNNNYTNNNKEDKDKSLYKKKSFNFKQSLIDIGVSNEVADDWIKVRKLKRAANTETAFNSIKRQIEKSGISANECITIAVERSWQGFKAEWVDNISTSLFDKDKYVKDKIAELDGKISSSKVIVNGVEYK